MKKFLLFLLTVAIAMAAQAEAHYKFWIGSTEVTSDNLNNITDASIKSGTAKYDANNNKLILTNVTIEPSNGTRAIRNQDCTNLTIEFRGTCLLKTQNADALRAESGAEVLGNTKICATSGSVVTIVSENSNAIFTQTDFRISGPGTFNITSDYNDQTILCKGWKPSAGSIVTGRDIGSLEFIENCNVSIKNTGNGNCIKGDNYSQLYFATGTVVFDNSSNKPCIENITTDDVSTSIYFRNNSAILDPFGAEKGDKSIVLNGEKVKGHLLISNDYVALINADYFPSAALRVALNELFPKSYITSSDVERLTVLNLSNRNLGNVTGINYLSNLKTLILSNNNLTSFAYELPVLETLYCDQNSLQSINLSGMPALKKLDCHENGLTTINVSNNPALNYVNAAENSLTSFNASENNAALERLFLGNNNFNTLTVYMLSGLKQLGCANCTNMTSLEATNLPNLTSIDAAGCSSLTRLSCWGSGVNSLSVANCTALAELRAYNCKFTTLSISGFSHLTTLDVGANPLLKTLYCSGNALSSLNFGACPLLQTVNCSNNGLTSLNTSDCPVLKTINASSNNFLQLNITGMSSLESLNVSNCSTLKFLHCENNALTSLNVTACPLLQNLNCSYNKFTTLTISGHSNLVGCDVSNNPYLKTLDCSNNALNSFSFNNCSALETANFSGNPGEGLQLSIVRLQKLRSLNLGNVSGMTKLTINEAAQLTSLNISGCNSMQILSVKYTGLTQLTANNLSNLTTFYCEQNNAMTQLQCCNNPSLQYMEAIWNSSLATLNCTDNTALTKLQCYINALTTLNVTGCTALETLVASQNALVNMTIQGTSLTTLDVSNTTSLTTLDCQSNALLSSLNVEGCTALENVYCQNCAFTELNLRNFPALKRIDASNNNLTSLNAAGSTALQHLLLQNNPSLSKFNITFEEGELLELNISKTQGIAYDYVGGMPKLQALYMDETSSSYSVDIHNNPCLTTLSIKNCPQLQSLYCDNNAIANLDVSGNTQMQSFACSNNALTSLRLQNCPALRFVNCFLNQLSNSAMTTLIGDLPTIPTSENPGNLRVLAATGEDNVFTSTHQADATAKRWNSLMSDGTPIITSALLGDINHSGKVDVTDVNIIINIMLGKAQASSYPGVADVNQSGKVDVTDVNKVINIMLGKEAGGYEPTQSVEVTYDYTTAASL